MLSKLALPCFVYRGWHVGAVVVFLAAGLHIPAVRAQIPAFPVGSIAAHPLGVGDGTTARLVWSIVLPESADPENYSHRIRQVQLPSGVMLDYNAGLSGQLDTSLAINSASKFELWTIRHHPLEVVLLDSILYSNHIPKATVNIRSEDPYSILPRTRADRPIHVDVTIEGIRDGEEEPAASKAVTFKRHVQSYGENGTGVGLDRSQAELVSQSTIATNGSTTMTYALNSVPGPQPLTVRGEERFSVVSVEDHVLPPSIISSKFIQVWPVADGSITGISEGQIIGPQVPPIKIHLDDLYPDSSTWVQVYKGGPRIVATGKIVPGTSLMISVFEPQDRILALSNYVSVFDSDGPWTMEILTRTPFGTDRLGHVSFTVHGLGMTAEAWRQIHFGSTLDSGDGANLNDFDHDGIPNLIEFGFGLDPKKSSAGMLPAPNAEGNDHVIRFTEPAGLKGISYGAEWSANLSAESWTAMPDSGEALQHVFRVPTAVGPNLFFRLKVNVP